MTILAPSKLIKRVTTALISNQRSFFGQKLLRGNPIPLCITSKPLPTVPEQAVLFQNHEVCIVKPNTSGSILVVHHCPTGVFDAVLHDGVKSREQLNREGKIPLLGKKEREDRIFGRHALFGSGQKEYTPISLSSEVVKQLIASLPPVASLPISCDGSYESLEDYDQNIFFRAFRDRMEIDSQAFHQTYAQHPSEWVAISVDPRKTFVYDSTARVEDRERDYNDSKISLYDLMNGKKSLSSEVLVKLPVVSPEWFATNSREFSHKLSESKAVI